MEAGKCCLLLQDHPVHHQSVHEGQDLAAANQTEQGRYQVLLAVDNSSSMADNHSKQVSQSSSQPPSQSVSQSVIRRHSEQLVVCSFSRRGYPVPSVGRSGIHSAHYEIEIGVNLNFLLHCAKEMVELCICCWEHSRFTGLPVVPASHSYERLEFVDKALTPDNSGGGGGGRVLDKSRRHSALVFSLRHSCCAHA